MISPDFQFDEGMHRYVVDNALQPHVTRILEDYGLTDYSDAPQDRVERKSVLGSAVHKITHLMDEDGISLDLALGQVCDEKRDQLIEQEILEDELLGYCGAWERFRSEADFILLREYIERRHVATVNGMRYGMTIDRAGLLRRRPTILDLKCTAKREKSWPIQLAGYALGLPRPSTVLRWERACVWLKPDATYSLCPGGRTRSDHVLERRDEEVFLAALRLTCWKIEQYGRWF